MHSPETLAFELKLPFGGTKTTFKDGTVSRHRPVLLTIWHVDPCTDGSDDSCGWFKRARHGDLGAVKRISKRMEFDWDRTFTSDESGKTYQCGYFNSATGMPVMPVHAIALNLFFEAAYEFFEHDRNKAWKYISKNLAKILLFAANTTDSLYDGFTMKFGGDGYTKATPEKRKRLREERIRSTASCIYAYILRDNQKWWQHPRWHVHHWQIQIPLWQRFNRWAFTRCCRCGGRFHWGESPCTDQWHNEGPRFLRGEKNVYHSRPPCGGCVAGATPKP